MMHALHMVYALKTYTGNGNADAYYPGDGCRGKNGFDTY